jgi:hypothetical protein
MSVYKAYRLYVFAFPQGYYRNEMILFRALHYWKFRFQWEQFFFFESADIQGGRIVLKVAPIHHWFESNAVRKSPTEIIAIGHFKGLFFSFKYWESKMLYR